MFICCTIVSNYFTFIRILLSLENKNFAFLSLRPLICTHQTVTVQVSYTYYNLKKPTLFICHPFDIANWCDNLLHFDFWATNYQHTHTHFAIHIDNCLSASATPNRYMKVEKRTPHTVLEMSLQLHINVLPCIYTYIHTYLKYLLWIW